jgi:hypothetical protein
MYGEAELKFACEKFRVRFSGELKQQCCDFKDSKGSGRLGLTLKNLIGAILNLASQWQSLPLNAMRL